MMWSTIGYTNPSNCASATGFMPCEARPTVRPAIVVSSSGVSSTRSDPNVACKPAVARNTPPLTPTSSPSTTTVSSLRISYARAWVIASISVIAAGAAVAGSAMATALPCDGFGTLREQVRRRIAVEVIEHRGHRLHLAFKVRIDLDVHQLAALLDPRRFLRFGPRAGGGEVIAQAHVRFSRPGRLDLVFAAIAARVVGGGVVVQAIGHELDAAAAFAVAGACDRATHAFEHGDEIVAVHLQAMQAAGDALLRERLRTGLRRARHRDRPAVVDDALDERQRVRAGGVDRRVRIGLRTAAVAAARHRHAFFAAQLEREGRARCVQALRGDRHAPRVIVLRAGEIVAAFVAAPVHQHFAGFDAAHELRAVLAIAGRKDVFGQHRGADAHVRGLVPEARGVRAELAGALQRDGLRIEGAHVQHLLEQRHERGRIAEGLREFRDGLAVGPEVLQVFDLELCGEGHADFVPATGAPDHNRCACSGRVPSAGRPASGEKKARPRRAALASFANRDQRTRVLLVAALLAGAGSGDAEDTSTDRSSRSFAGRCGEVMARSTVQMPPLAIAPSSVQVTWKPTGAADFAHVQPTGAFTTTAPGATSPLACSTGCHAPAGPMLMMRAG